MGSLNTHNAGHGSVFSPIVSLSGECDAHDLGCERLLRSAQRQQARDSRLPLASLA